MRVISNGMAHGTKVLNNEGEDITAELRITKISIIHAAGDIPRLHLKCIPDEIDVTTITDETRHYVKGTN